MADRKRTSAQRAVDLIEIETLALQGKTQVEIAEELSSKRDYTLSRQQIQYDVRKLEKIWAEEVKAEINTAKGRALAEVKQLQREYWTAWKRSQENAESETTKLQGTGSDKEKPGKLEKTIRSEGQSGDPRFLQGIQWCITKRCELLGLDAPVAMDLNLFDMKGWAENRKERLQQVNEMGDE